MVIECPLSGVIARWFAGSERASAHKYSWPKIMNTRHGHVQGFNARAMM
ncbi:hypothetical protein Despr_1471 [Desulfobulbus propionicus DSM 2032]|jgi:hypothetical protein|uniref:Uncharacterized protein n=1 Tax=Desulfobulbus propionicus (strain ATCC 33891 / DSM 2032 / VKM B-1956 / 1pr3) TaxID=577650 RepID=A0A7U4DP01_DESPD|nr:hypothetical protein [Desulfobulbus propionicus]ADW17626.1 hypothetical protein Despr_1471 [Desulfobulbus propionicus DSM 2032]